MQWTRSTSYSAAAWLLALCTAGCAGPAARREAGVTSPAPAAPAAPQTGSDATIDAFLTSLQHRDYAAASAKLTAEGRAAFPQDKLATVWDGLVAQVGKPSSWKILERTQQDGIDARMVLVTFEHAQGRIGVSVVEKSQEITEFRIRSLDKTPAKAAGPAPYVNSSAFRTEEVTVGKAPFALGGTLTVPTGTGPFPAAILVHGSGPSDRDESHSGNKPFKDLAEGLASRGIAVLRYDKRTFAHASKLGNSITIDDEVVLDAISAVDLLRARADVDPRRVFVIGHSLGAQLAPEIAVRAKSVAGAILLAPPGRAPWDVIVAQMRYLGAPSDTLAELEKTVALLKAGKLGTGMLLGAPASYWQDMASHDGVAMAKKLGKPLLVLRGDRDYQVTDEDIAVWRKGLDGVGGVEIAPIPGANHLFMLGTGKPGPAEYDIPGHVDESVVKKLASFIDAAR